VNAPFPSTAMRLWLVLTMSAAPPRVWRRIIFGVALGVDRSLGPLRAFGREEGQEIRKPGIAMLGKQSVDAVAALPPAQLADDG
jgi:hypothetical protein